MSHEYFKELKEWSARKLELLTKYLDGFVRILGGGTGLVVYYIDGFAGPGIYDDEKEGSPLLAAKYAQGLIGKHYSLHCINIELDGELYENLVQNTLPYQSVTTNLFGPFGDNVDQVLNKIDKLPAIFFLDPFGIKGIEMRHIYKVLKRSHVTELLLRVDPKDVRRLAGFSDSESQGAVGKRHLLTDLYGFSETAKWEQAWYTDGVEGLVNLYMGRLQMEMSLEDNQVVYVYKYPIRSIEGELKYYLIFATRHAKGAVLMNDTVYNREETYEREVKEYKASKPQQLSLFDTPKPTEEEIFEAKVVELREDIRLKFKGKTDTRLNVREATLDKWFGRITGRHFTRAFKEMQKEGFVTGFSGPPSNDDTIISFTS